MPAALAFRWQGDPLHSRLHELAFGITKGFSRTIAAKAPLVLLMDGDIGRTLGEILRRELNVSGDIISVDGVQLRTFDYVDIGELIEPTHVVPLIIKSLLFSTGDSDYRSTRPYPQPRGEVFGLGVIRALRESLPDIDPAASFSLSPSRFRPGLHRTGFDHDALRCCHRNIPGSYGNAGG